MGDVTRPRVTHATAKVTGGRLRLPAAVLREFGLEEGQEVIFFLRPGHATALVAPLTESMLNEPDWK